MVGSADVGSIGSGTATNSDDDGGSTAPGSPTRDGEGGGGGGGGDKDQYCVTKAVYKAMYARLYELLVPSNVRFGRKRNLKRIIQVCGGGGGAGACARNCWQYGGC